MKSTNYPIATVIILSFFLFKDAYAYLDPGTGSIIVQFLIALFAGLSFAVRIYWKKIKTVYKLIFFKKKKHDQGESQ